MDHQHHGETTTAASTTTTTTASRKEENEDEGGEEEEDLSLDLPPGENWMFLTTSYHLLPSQQASQSRHPIAPHASIHPVSAFTSSKHPAPSLHPGGDYDSLSIKTCFLVIDIDNEYCTVKDIRIMPPSAVVARDDEDNVNEEGKADENNKHYRFSICRRTHALQLPATWIHFSFTRRLCHLHHGDRLILWETSDSNPNALPSLSRVCCVWEKVYQTTVETGDEEDMMVSQLEVDDTNIESEGATNTQLEQVLLTQGTAAHVSSLTSPPLATQPESPKKQKQSIDDNDDDEDDITVDPRESIAPIGMEKTLIRGKTESQHARDTSEAEQTLQPDIRDCFVIASRLQERESQLVATPPKRTRGLNADQLRSPDLMDDSSIEEESQKNNEGLENPANSQQGVGVSVAERTDTRSFFGSKKRDSRGTGSEEVPLDGVGEQKNSQANTSLDNSTYETSSVAKERTLPDESGKLDSVVATSEKCDPKQWTTVDKESKENNTVLTKQPNNREDEKESTQNHLSSKKLTEKLENERSSPLEEPADSKSTVMSPKGVDGGQIVYATVEQANDSVDTKSRAAFLTTLECHGPAVGKAMNDEDITTDRHERKAENGQFNVPTEIKDEAKVVSNAKVTLDAAAIGCSKEKSFEIPCTKSNATRVPDLGSMFSSKERTSAAEDKSTEKYPHDSVQSIGNSEFIQNLTAAERVLEKKRKLSETKVLDRSGDDSNHLLESEEAESKSRRKRVQKSFGYNNSALILESNHRSCSAPSESKQMGHAFCVSTPEDRQWTKSDGTIKTPLESKGSGLQNKGAVSLSDTSETKDKTSQSSGQNASRVDFHEFDRKDVGPRLFDGEKVRGRKRKATPKKTEKVMNDEKIQQTSTPSDARKTRASTRHKTAMQSNSKDDEINDVERSLIEEAIIGKGASIQIQGMRDLNGGSETHRSAPKTRSESGRKRSTRDISQDDNYSKMRQHQNATRTRSRGATGTTPISKANEKRGTPRAMCRRKTDEHEDDKVPVKTDGIYLLATGCDGFEKKMLVVSSIL